MEPTILSARRAYEYKIDDLRLSLLSSANVIQYLQELVNGSFAQAGSPPPTFGNVLPTYPPGIVVGLGTIVLDAETQVALRSFNVEPTRLVFDVAGPSSAIEFVFDLVKSGLSSLVAPDGARAIGEYVNIRDYSEIRWSGGSGYLSRLITPPVLAVLWSHLGTYLEHEGRAFVPSLRINMPIATSMYSGQGTSESESMFIDLRFGTTIDEGVLFTAAPLRSDDHIALVQDLMGVLTSEGPGIG